MEKRWSFKEEADGKLSQKLAVSLNIQPQLAALLVQRGISTFEEAKIFFRPSLDMLHDPFLMKDMDIAIERIETALGNGEKIMVYGDYDVDGTTAVSLVYSFFHQYTDQIIYYIPDRYKEGYGVSYQGIDFAAEQNIGLIIALDCGIKAIDKVDYAKEKGLDFIICDHHRPGDQIPSAYAVLDPKRKDCSYPYDELSGCGIGFKLVQAYCQKHEIAFENIEGLLDIVAVSIAADIVPVTGENRALAYFGLIRLNTNPRIGIDAIFQIAKKRKGNINFMDLGFTVGPRINAAGRIESGNRAVELLTAPDKDKAEEICALINEHNETRRELDQGITQEALAMIEADEELRNAKSTVLYQEHWHKGVIGIVASRVMETYYRPTIIFTESNGKAAGSARSVLGFDVYNALEACTDVLEQFGGHMYAAGMTIKTDKIPEFREKFEAVVSSTIPEELLVPEIKIDIEISFDELYDQQAAKQAKFPAFYRILKQFGPFGPMNESPVFLTKGVMDSGYSKVVGEKHLKLTLKHPDSTLAKFSGIGFNLGQHLDNVKSRAPFDIVYIIEENEWMGERNLQLRILDLKF